MPFIDQLTGESFTFEEATVAGTPTYYSLPAIMASRYPLGLGRDVVGLAPEEPTLTSALHDAGYATAAFVAGNPYLSPRFGYSQHFDCFQDFLTSSEGEASKGRPEAPSEAHSPFRRRVRQALEHGADTWPWVRSLYDELYFHYCLLMDDRWRKGAIDAVRQYPRADVVIDAAGDWIDRRDDHPFFLWIHLMDPHHPYYPPSQALEELGRADLTPRRRIYLNETWKRGDLSVERLRHHRQDVMTLYEAGIRWADAQIKRLVERLQARNLWRDTLFVLTSDHGEEFLEHGGRFHYPHKLTQELIHVPLAIHHPHGKRQGRIKGPFSLIDLAPTLLDMLNIASPETFVGRSRWDGSGIDDRPDGRTVTECVYNCRNPWQVDDRLGPRLLAVRNGRYKLVLDFAAGEDRLFDLDNDLEERAPIPTSAAPQARRRLLEAALDHVRRTRPQPSDRRRLRARMADTVRSLSTEWAV